MHQDHIQRLLRAPPEAAPPRAATEKEAEREFPKDREEPPRRSEANSSKERSKAPWSDFKHRTAAAPSRKPEALLGRRLAIQETLSEGKAFRSREASARARAAAVLQRLLLKDPAPTAVKKTSPNAMPMHPNPESTHTHRERERESVLRFSLLDAGPSLGSLSSHARLAPREERAWAPARQEATVSVASAKNLEEV